MNPFSLLPPLLLVAGMAEAVPACTLNTTWLQLELTATATELPTQRVRVSTDGCVIVDAPLDNPSDDLPPVARSLQLAGSEVAALQGQVNGLPPNSFNAPYIRGQVASRVAARAGTSASVAGVLNGDRLKLTLTSSPGTRHSIDWYGLYFDQQRFPDVIELAALAQLSRNLRALSFDARLQGATP